MRLDLSAGDVLPTIVRAAAGDAASLELVIAHDHDPVTIAVARAMLAPLAVELAPATRVNAVLVLPGAAAAGVAAAAAFLAGATSTTGQWIEISPWPSPADARTGQASR